MIESIFQFDDAAVLLRTDEPSAARWATDFLQPFFLALHPNQVTAPDDEVMAVFRELAPVHPPDGGTPVSLFLRRHGRRVFGDGVDVVVADDEPAAVYLLRPGSVRAYYGSAGKDQLREASRLVRECAIERLLEQGAIRVHAAACALADAGVLLVGPPGSGKSTTLAQLLAAGADFVANDRVLVTSASEDRAVLGVPLAVRWSTDQLNLFEHGAAFVASYDEVSQFRRTDQTAGFPKFELTPAEVRDITGRPLVPRAPLRAVVLLERGGSEPAALTEARATEAVSRLHREVLLEDPAFPAFFRTAGAAPRTAGAAPHTPAAPIESESSLRWLRLSGAVDDANAADLIRTALG